MVGELGLYNLGIATDLGKDNSDFKYVKLNLKVDLLSLSTNDKGSSRCIYIIIIILF